MLFRSFSETVRKSSNTFRALLTITRPGRLLPPTLTSFLLFHIPQQIKTHLSSSPGWAIQPVRSRLKVSTKLQDSWILQGRASLLSFQTSVPQLQKQSTCMVVSVCPQQASHVLDSVIILRKRDSLVGRIPLQAFHAKCLILFGTFRLQTPLQTPCIFDGSKQPG